jgi:hypothetical protein
MSLSEKDLSLNFRYCFQDYKYQKVSVLNLPGNLFKNNIDKKSSSFFIVGFQFLFLANFIIFIVYK